MGLIASESLAKWIGEARAFGARFAIHFARWLILVQNRPLFHDFAKKFEHFQIVQNPRVWAQNFGKSEARTVVPL